ncbi:MAG: hypothetical protein WD850_03570 [Candidatus Spechtbacterales bacterium]
MNKKRKIFFVMAGGGHDTDRHYYDTILNKRPVSDFSRFLGLEEKNILEEYAHGRPYAVWGAVPGVSNIRNWEAMEAGDYVMVYRRGKIILAAEIGMKIRNAALAEYFWQKDSNGKTWELIYFMINEVDFSVDIEKLNEYLGYQRKYHPQGFMAVDQTKADRILSDYGDLISLLQKLQSGERVEKIEIDKGRIFEAVDEEIKKQPTEHSEMQWRLIRLGLRSHFDVWVPENDKGKEYNGEVFRPMVLEDFHETLDVPIYIKNIDAVWKLGQSVKAAFEVENSTSVYSGILRLSDLRALTPNSNYPLFIVAPRERRKKVFNELQRPTFSNSYLELDRVVKYLSYDSIRDLDETVKEDSSRFDIDWLLQRAEVVTR